MVSFHSGSRSKLIEINSEVCALVITGEIANEKIKQLAININVPASIIVNSEIEQNIAVKTVTDFGDLVQNSGTTMRPCFFEDGQYQLILEMKTSGKYDIFNREIRLTDDFQVVGNCYIGIIDFSSDIGYTNIDIHKDGKKILSVILEVFPSKLDYYKDYKDIINEINEEICSLAFKFLDKTYLTSKLKTVDFQTNAEFVNILDIIFEDLDKAIKRIVTNFKHNIVSHKRFTQTHKAKKVSNKNRSYIRSHPEVLIRSKGGFLNIGEKRYYPLKVIEEKKITTIDIFENQFVKYMIKRIINRLSLIENNINLSDNRENAYLEIISKRKRILEGYLRRYFENVSDLDNEKSMSLVFQMAPGYREMYIKYSILNKGLDLGDDLFKITPKKIYLLYEIWCYTKIHKILSELGYDVEEYGILQYKDNGMYLSLLHDSEAKMVYKSNKNKLELWYNKSYASPTTSQRPDTVLYIKNIDERNDKVYIFDAKYRIHVDDRGNIGPMEEDINIMHRYRDAIVSKISDNFKYKYDTFGAYVMFPYGDEEKFKKHKFYKSIQEVNVGAFPMLPGSTNLIRKQLEKIINQSDLEAKSERVISDEYDDYAKYKLENVMVVNVKDEYHMKKYIENNFYHIPIKRLSNIRLGVDYIAFYQSKTSFGDKSGIRFFAKITEVAKYKRKECKELPARPGTEEDLYLRLNFSDVEEIRVIEPIQSGTQLVSYTTLYLLKNAENMHELKLRSNLEIEVYKRIKHFAKSKGYNIRKEFNQYIVNNNTIEIIEDKVLRVNGKIANLINMEKILQ